MLLDQLGGQVELQDYLRMLRRGWRTILGIIVLAMMLAVAYLVVAPKQYEATTALFVSASDPSTIDDLQQGNQFAGTAVITYAEIIDSSSVLDPVARELRPQRDVDQLVAMVTCAVREETTLIDVTAAGNDPEEVATVANAAAESAIRIIPTLQTTPSGRPLVRVQQIRPAIQPVSAVSPDVQRVLAIGLIAGMFVGLATTIARQTLDTRIQRAEDLRALTEVPLLAVLSRLGLGWRARLLGRSGPPSLAVRDAPSGPAAESFRTLRTNLRFLGSRNRRSLVFAAATDDNDEVQVPANLAWSLALTGQRVLLVDLDLRRSAVGDAHGIDAGPGLADVLMQKVDLSLVIHEIEDSGLRILLSGTPHPSPSDLLSRPTMAGLLRRLEEENDYVILHAPALLSYVDAAVLSETAGGTVVSVRAGRTRRQELSKALDALEGVRVKPMGMVMTGGRRTDEPEVSTRSSGPPQSVSTNNHHQDSATQNSSATDSPTLRNLSVRPSPRPHPDHPVFESRPQRPGRTP